jgi:hypothetical protein
MSLNRAVCRHACSWAQIKPASMVRFWVRDNGRGLTAEEQARLFKLFTRPKPPQGYARLGLVSGATDCGKVGWLRGSVHRSRARQHVQFHIAGLSIRIGLFPTGRSVGGGGQRGQDWVTRRAAGTFELQTWPRVDHRLRKHTPIAPAGFAPAQSVATTELPIQSFPVRTHFQKRPLTS